MAIHDHHQGALMRRLLALAGAAALSGCAVYAPPYAAYDPAPVVAPYYAYPYGYSYGYGYGYGRPAYVGPPVSLNFGYYEHRYRGGHGGYGGPGWRGGHGGGRGWGGHGGWRGGGRGHR